MQIIVPKVFGIESCSLKNIEAPIAEIFGSIICFLYIALFISKFSIMHLYEFFRVCSAGTSKAVQMHSNSDSP